jgi:hypothetical protein
MQEFDEQYIRLALLQGIMFKMKCTHDQEELNDLLKQYETLLDDIVAFEFPEPEYKIDDTGKIGLYF